MFECSVTAAMLLKVVMASALLRNKSYIKDLPVAGFPFAGVPVWAFVMHQVATGRALVGNCFLFHLI